jgi:hypothetical protein
MRRFDTRPAFQIAMPMSSMRLSGRLIGAQESLKQHRLSSASKFEIYVMKGIVIQQGVTWF